jgi:hypothetical protein
MNRSKTGNWNQCASNGCFDNDVAAENAGVQQRHQGRPEPTAGAFEPSLGEYVCYGCCFRARKDKR